MEDDRGRKEGCSLTAEGKVATLLLQAAGWLSLWRVVIWGGVRLEQILSLMSYILHVTEYDCHPSYCIQVTHSPLKRHLCWTHWEVTSCELCVCVFTNTSMLHTQFIMLGPLPCGICFFAWLKLIEPVAFPRYSLLFPSVLFLSVISSYIFLLILGRSCCTSFFFICVHGVMPAYKSVWAGWIPLNWSYTPLWAATWVLRTEPGSSSQCS